MPDESHQSKGRSFLLSLAAVFSIISIAFVIIFGQRGLIDLFPNEERPDRPFLDLPWSTVAGPSCPNTTVAEFAADPPLSGELDGFTNRAGTGWAADGCGGDFLITRSTVAHEGQVEDTATWRFTPPAQTASCRLSLFVPATEEELAPANVWVAGPAENDWTDRQWGGDVPLEGAKGTWVTIASGQPITPHSGVVVVNFADSSYLAATTTDRPTAVSAIVIGCQ